MKAKRTKANRKTMNIYTSSYNFREPFRILVDADFALQVIAQKLDIQDRLQATLCGQVNPTITQCCLNHLYDLGVAGQPAVELAREWTRKKCNHWQTKASTAECIAGVIGEKNARQYCVATQSADFRAACRSIPGLPIVYLNPQSVLILEPPSEATVGKRKEIEETKLHATSTELANLPNIVGLPSSSNSTPVASTSATYKTAEQTIQAKKKRQGPKAPNPLSIKKKSKKSAEAVKKGIALFKDQGKQKAKPPSQEGEGKKEPHAVLQRTARDVVASSATSSGRKRTRKRGKKDEQ